MEMNIRKKSKTREEKKKRFEKGRSSVNRRLENYRAG